MYLSITSPNEVAPEAFTLLGATSKRQVEKAGVIGMFGSGNKYATATLLRHDLQLCVVSGDTVLKFTKAPGVFRGVNHERVLLNGEALAWTTDYGVQDWTVAMALREFVANAIDECTDGELPYLRFTTTLPESAPGHTVVCVEANEEVEKFMDEIHKYFLHWLEPDHLDTPLKVVELGPAQLYRRGVWIGESTIGQTVFRYNVDFDLTEARTLETSNVNEGAWRAWQQCEDPVLIQTLLRHLNQTDTDGFAPWEDGVSFLNIGEAKKPLWQKAWVAEFGDRAVLASDRDSNVRAASMGYKVLELPTVNFMLRHYAQVPSANKLASPYEAMKHHKVAKVPMRVSRTFQHCWTWLEDHQLTRGRPKPGLFCFETEVVGAQALFGVCGENSIGISVNVTGKMLWAVMLEEFAHYITKAGDETRDLQSFAFNLAAHAIIQGEDPL